VRVLGIRSFTITKDFIIKLKSVWLKLNIIECINMEDVRQLMEMIDCNVKSFPEGDYLKMCDNIKNIFEVVKTRQDDDSDDDGAIDFTYEEEEEDLDLPYVIVENTDPLNIVPLGRSIIDLDLQRTQIHQEYTSITDHLREASRIFKGLKMRRNITARVRYEAVKQFCDVRMLHVSEYTLHAVKTQYPQYTFPDERAFFYDFLISHNERVRDQMYDLSNQINILKVKRDECVERYHECQ